MKVICLMNFLWWKCFFTPENEKLFIFQLEFYIFSYLKAIWLSLLTRFMLSVTSVSTLVFIAPFVPVLLLLPLTIKLVCFINLRAFGDNRKRNVRGTVCSWDCSVANVSSGHILCINLIPSLTVDRLCILSSDCSTVQKYQR